jgi:flagellar biosynthesis protein FlhA
MMMAAPPLVAPAITFKQLMKHNDVFLAVGIVLILGMMLLPLPAFILDILLTINIALSITILLVTLYTKEPLQYSTFPTLLLMSTLFRLGLNVSSTRLILLTGQPGEVITAFGNFVIGGNYVVGLLIFIILMIINFMVITNGAGRVSEVSARFTLDALPGKQLSIDADLNAGLINEEQARMRRINIQKEADFYGTMDGASKFVKGDAIAGLIITAINIVFGLIIGVVQMGMPVAEAAATFTTLSVGDGLVSSLPAIIISTATGILVTRVSETEDSSLGDDLGNQLFTNPKVLGILGGLLTCMGFVPGMPNIPFLLIGGLACFASYHRHTHMKLTEATAIEATHSQKLLETQEKAPTSGEQVMELLQIEAMELEIGYRLVPLIEPEAGGDLLDRIGNIRRQMAQELGIVLPSVRVRDNLQADPDTYALKLKGVPIGHGTIKSDMLMAMCTDPDLADAVSGIETTEPAFGLPALWIELEDREEAEMNGYTVIQPSAVVSTHLTELIRKFAPQILSRQDVKILVDHLKKTHESLVEDLVPTQLTLSELHIVLQLLLAEKVSIRDLATVLESISYHCRISKSPEYLAEQCRIAMSRSICRQLLDPSSEKLPVLTVSPEIEEEMANNMVNLGSNEGYTSQSLALSPSTTQRFLKAVNAEVERVLVNEGVQPVLLCNAKLRPHIRKLVERLLPQLSVLSYTEVGPSTQVKTLGSIRFS